MNEIEISKIMSLVENRIKFFCKEKGVHFSKLGKCKQPIIYIKHNNNWRKMHGLPLIRRKGKRKWNFANT